LPRWGYAQWQKGLAASVERIAEIQSAAPVALMRRGAGVPLSFCDTTSQKDVPLLGCSSLVMRRQPLAGGPSLSFGLAAAETAPATRILDLQPWNLILLFLQITPYWPIYEHVPGLSSSASPSQFSRQCRSVICNGGRLPLVSPSCGMTWPI
jgi:hypothetical protein